jgi:hypothetical protein
MATPAVAPFRRRGELIVLAAFLALACAETGVYTDLASRSYGGGQGDPCIDGWVLSRVSHQLLHDPLRPFDGNIYFPSYDSVLLTDPLLGPSVLVLPLRLFSANPILLYNGAILLVLTLSSYGFYRLALRLGAARGAALLAGVAIPFSASQTDHLFHLNLLTLTFFPFLLAAILDLIESPRLRPALVAGACFALQAGTSGYHAFSAALLALVCLGWGVRRLGDWRVWGYGLLAAGLAALLLAPYLTGFLWVGRHEADMHRELSVAAGMSMDLAGLVASKARVLQGVLPDGQPFFPGFVTLGFAGFALRDLRRDRYVPLLCLVAVAGYSLALGPEVRLAGHRLGPGPFALLRNVVPFLDAMRHPLSFAVLGQIGLGLLACLGLSRSGLARSRAGLAAVLAAATLETFTVGPARKEAPRALLVPGTPGSGSHSGAALRRRRLDLVGRLAPAQNRKRHQRLRACALPGALAALPQGVEGRARQPRGHALSRLPEELVPDPLRRRPRQRARGHARCGGGDERQPGQDPRDVGR